MDLLKAYITDLYVSGKDSHEILDLLESTVQEVVERENAREETAAAIGSYLYRYLHKYVIEDSDDYPLYVFVLQAKKLIAQLENEIEEDADLD